MYSRLSGCPTTMNYMNITTTTTTSTTTAITTATISITAMTENNNINLSSTAFTVVQEILLAGSLILLCTQVLPQRGIHYHCVGDMSQTPLQGGSRIESGNQSLITNELPSPNISRDEFKVLKELSKDKSRVILTEDKVVTMIVLHKQDYLNKIRTY